VGKEMTTLGRATLGFAKLEEVDTFVETLGRFERGEIDADAWRAFRLVAGTYGQRQEGDLSMLRAKIPQGILTAGQLEVVADVAERLSRGFAHITTRQNFQLHFIKLADIPEAMRLLADVGITTREACGNSVRNITMSPTAGVAHDDLFDPEPYAEALTRYCLRHPLSASLPRKFKMAMTGGGSDHAFALINDIGWHARVKDEAGVSRRGFRVTVGGGTALWCQSGRELFDFLPAGEMLAVVHAILKVFHAHGDRVHRHKNRIRYLIKSMGWETWKGNVLTELDAIRAVGVPPLPFDPDRPPESAPLHERAPFDAAHLAALVAQDQMRGPGIVPRFLPVVGDDTGERFRRTNVQPQRQPGYSMVTVTVPMGDLSSGRLRALAHLARAFGEGEVRTTIAQNLLLRFVPTSRVGELYAALRAMGLAAPDPDSIADVTSCPGAESCKLAVTQSRGLASDLASAFQSDRSYVDRAPGLVVKVSGCPNGCGLHHIAGLGFQGGLRKIDGRAVPYYHVYAGGDPSGDTAKFGRIIGKLPARRVTLGVKRLIALYEEKREPGESVTAYFSRAPVAELKGAIRDLEELTEATATPDDYIDLGETEAFRPETTEGECAA
jgi:sulfite reductase beta subunit-like hemoprotein